MLYINSVQIEDATYTPTLRRVLTDNLNIPWELTWLLVLAVFSFVYALMKIGVMESADEFAVMNDRSIVGFHYCQFLMRHPTSILAFAIFSFAVHYFALYRRYQWPLRWAMMFPIYAFLALNIVALSYLGGKFIRFGNMVI